MACQTLDSAIKEAEFLLKESEDLLKKYPDKFSVRVSRDNWNERVNELKNKKLTGLKCPYCNHPLESHERVSDSIHDGSKCNVEGCNCHRKPEGSI